MDLAKFRVISSGLGSVVPTQILGSARGGSLVYHPPQTVLWWRKNGVRRHGDGAKHVSAVAGLCS